MALTALQRMAAWLRTPTLVVGKRFQSRELQILGKRAGTENGNGSSVMGESFDTDSAHSYAKETRNTATHRHICYFLNKVKAH